MAKAGESVETYLFRLLLSKLNIMIISINYARVPAGIKQKYILWKTITSEVADELFWTSVCVELISYWGI